MFTYGSCGFLLLGHSYCFASYSYFAQITLNNLKQSFMNSIPPVNYPRFAVWLAVIVASITSLVQGCSNKQGPCEWHDQEKFLAEIKEVTFLDFNESGDSLFTVILQLDRGSLSDKPFDLGKFKKIAITRDFVSRNKIQVGYSFTGRITDLKSGNCETPVVAFDQKLR